MLYAAMNWTIPELTTRETAITVWVVLILMYAVWKSPGVLRSFGSLLRTLVTSAFLLGMILTAVAFSFATILLLTKVGYWEHDMIKVVVFWFIGIALVAMFRTKRTDTPYFRTFVLDNAGLAAVIAFVVGFHTFPLPVEMILVPLLFMLVGVQAYAAGKPKYASVGAPVTNLLTLLGATAFVYSIVYIATHSDQTVTTANAKEFALPLLLSACFLPYLYTLRMVAVWQSMLHMIKFGLRGDERLYRFARRSIMRACGLNLFRAQVFEERFRGRLWGVTTEEDVTRVVGQFIRTWARARRMRLARRCPSGPPR
jgi:hypothetical protein